MQASVTQGVAGSSPVLTAYNRRSSQEWRRFLFYKYPITIPPHEQRFTADRTATFRKAIWFVYILRCSDDKPYTGYTKDLTDRLSRHKRGSVPSTKNRRPLDLETFFAFSDQYQAIEFEKNLKSGSGRAVMNKRFFKRAQ